MSNVMGFNDWAWTGVRRGGKAGRYDGERLSLGLVPRLLVMLLLWVSHLLSVIVLSALLGNGRMAIEIALGCRTQSHLLPHPMLQTSSYAIEFAKSACVSGEI